LRGSPRPHQAPVQPSVLTCQRLLPSGVSGRHNAAVRAVVDDKGPGAPQLQMRFGVHGKSVSCKAGQPGVPSERRAATGQGAHAPSPRQARAGCSFRHGMLPRQAARAGCSFSHSLIPTEPETKIYTCESASMVGVAPPIPTSGRSKQRLYSCGHMGGRTSQCSVCQAVVEVRKLLGLPGWAHLVCACAMCPTEHMHPLPGSLFTAACSHPCQVPCCDAPPWRLACRMNSASSQLSGLSATNRHASEAPAGCLLGRRRLQRLLGCCAPAQQACPT